MEQQIPQSILAVDLGGTSILLGEVTLDGKVLYTQSYPTNTATQAAAMENIQKAISHYLDTVPKKASELIAIGIGVVGRVDRGGGVWMEIEPGKTNPTNASRIIEQHFGLPCGIDNDVSCATLAELKHGWGKESKDFIYLNVGTGIAAGFVVNGVIIEGSHFNAGEIGHMVVDMNSDAICTCGRRGCVERLSSGLGLHERVMRLRSEYPDTAIAIEEGERVAAQAIFKHAQEGDPLAERIAEEGARALAAAIMNMVRISDPDTIVLGGGVGGNTYFKELVEQHLNPKTMRFVTNGLRGTKQATPEAGLVGAAMVGLEAWTKKQGSVVS
ncbi:ROK family protein [Paenibacillus sp. 1011MAR3C5]|uniref:ROK family protein n=1 Tax=Paenibacillus sp. 1011MAR3C5 TaxID=1675787 RepID=UPI000E6C7FEA|nr:ROK family protein [Paenibacillus sp. 1011MAR3C5]RJE85124.1 ROK family protein [Paenibacillus sp. 1011MAR3C5]